MRYKQTATTWAHQKARDAHVQLHDVIRRRSKVTATLNVLDLPCAVACALTTDALKWKPFNQLKRFDSLAVDRHFTISNYEFSHQI